MTATPHVGLIDAGKLAHVCLPPPVTEYPNHDGNAIVLDWPSFQPFRIVGVGAKWRCHQCHLVHRLQEVSAFP